MLMGTRMQSVTTEQLEAARRRWQQAQITDYDMELEVSGAQSGRYDIAVRQGKLQRMVRDGHPASPIQGKYWTVKGLFRTIELELQWQQPPVSTGTPPPGNTMVLLARFDSKLGLVREYSRQMTDESRSVRIRLHRFDRR